MNNENTQRLQSAEPTEMPQNLGFVQWLQNPMGSIIASSVAVIGSFGFVLSGTWLIHQAVG